MNHVKIMGLLIGSIVLSSFNFGSVTGQDVSISVANDELTFATVNGITLYDNQETIVMKLGEPDFVEVDPLIKDLVIYQYPAMNICFYSGELNYVEVLPEGGTIKIDDAIIPIRLVDLKKALGKPDFIAEDGIVFQRNDAVIKIFIDDTEEVIAIDYYHISSI